MVRVVSALFVASVLSLACAPAARAADMPVKAPAIVADPWTGWYLGASVGGRWNHDTWTAASFGDPPFAGILNSRDNPHDFNSSSLRLGAYGGYNWRVQQMWVVGLEADFAWASDKQTSAGSIPGLFLATVESVQMKDTWDGGLRARLGYLITPATLLYATGGASWMKSQAGIFCAVGAPNWCTGSNLASLRTDSVSKTVAGWTLGAGLETMVTPNWYLRGEYRYTSYTGYHMTLLRGGSGGGGSGNDVIDADIGRIRTHTALIGLAYRFGH